MPNWKVHLEIAKRLNQKFRFSKIETEEFNLGNILPDINNCYIVTDISKNIEHKYTHYQDSEEIPSYKNFIEIFKSKIYEEPIIFGYYIHLYTDYTWNNYFYTNYNNHEKLKEMTHSEKRIIKQHDFKVYNDLFMENKPQFTNTDNLLEKTKLINRVSITEDDIKKVETFLKNQKKYNQDFQILSKEILDEMIKQTITYFEKSK